MATGAGGSHFTFMDEILHALGNLLVRALPTFFLILALHFYLKYVFFRPLQRVLQTRHEATEGARQLAEASLQRAGARTAEYQQLIRAARAEIYQEHEQLHRRLQEERTAQVQSTRQQAEASIAAAKAELAGEVTRAKALLAAQSEALANEIANAIVSRRAA